MELFLFIPICSGYFFFYCNTACNALCIRILHFGIIILRYRSFLPSRSRTVAVFIGFFLCNGISDTCWKSCRCCLFAMLQCDFRNPVCKFHVAIFTCDSLIIKGHCEMELFLFIPMCSGYFFFYCNTACDFLNILNRKGNLISIDNWLCDFCFKSVNRSFFYRIIHFLWIFCQSCKGCFPAVTFIQLYRSNFLCTDYQVNGHFCLFIGRCIIAPYFTDCRCISFFFWNSDNQITICTDTSAT